MHKFAQLLACIALVTAVLACNLPSQQGVDAVTTALAQTAAAQTVQAALTQAGQPPSGAPTSTFTPIPSPLPTVPLPTLPPPATATSSCDNAQFITDVSYPDNTVVTPNTNFTKTWRLKNVGTCSWTPSYAVVFFSGEQMSGPSVQALAGNVNPGQTIDISVNLTSPGSDGIKVGYWKLRNASGVTFAQFYVQIKVQSGGGATSHIVTLAALSGESGSVKSDGGVISPTNAGDSSLNVTYEAFFSFDISGIPAAATIVKVVPQTGDYDILGNPFSISDGCVRAYQQDYGSLGASDYFPGDPLGAIARWCSTADLNDTVNQPDMVTALQAKVGSSRFQFRMQFRTPTTNGNGVDDAIRFGAVKLKITYSTP